MFSNQSVTLNRNCEGILIPSGEKIELPKGTEVSISQALGGTYTVVTNRGYLLRISSHNADALGVSPEKGISSDRNSGLSVEEQVWECLRTCYDPEIPVNIVDLGLIYECDVAELAEKSFRVRVRMTLTAPGCGMGNVLRTDVEEKIRLIPGVQETDIELTFDPPWDQSRMADAVRLQLNLF